MNEKGDADFLLLMYFVLVLVIGGIIWGLVSDSNQTNRFNAWTRDCLQAKGHVEIVAVDRYECFINGKLTVLPGWEGY